MDLPNANPSRQLTPDARERMRAGQHKGLLRAVAKRKADCSADYAPNLDHGQTTPDFERSAEAAGETREEVRNHLSLVDRALLTLCGFFPRIAEALSGAVSRPTFGNPLTPGPSPPRGRGETRFENSESGFGDSESRFKDSVAGSGLAPLAGNGVPSPERNGPPAPAGNGVPSPTRNGLPSPAGNELATPAGNELPSPPWGRGAGSEGDLKIHASHDPRLPLQTDAASPRAPKLVRALALLLWRPLRLFRTQEHWEWLALCYHLGQVVRWRQKHGDLTVERVEQFHEHLDAIIHNYDREVDWRLKRIEKRFWKVWRLYRSLVGVVAAVLGSERAEAGSQESEVRSQEIHAQPRATSGVGSHRPNSEPVKSELRTDELRTDEPHTVGYAPPVPLIQVRGKPHYEQFHPSWLERIDELTPEAIADPFQSPSHTLRAQRKRTQTAAVKDPKLWQERPATPPLAQHGLPERVASSLIRDPSERQLRRMVRSGELTVPGTLEDFATLLEAALGPVAQPLLAVRKENQSSHSTAKSGCATSEPYVRGLAESLWNRTHVFSARAAELRELLEATLLWEPGRFLRLWLKLLPVEYAYGEVDFFGRTHGPHHQDIAWGDDETTLPWRDGKLRPAERPGSEAEERRVQAGELQHALRIWFVAVWHALVAVMRASHQVTVALYDWAVSRFGIREEFLYWRPNLSLAQLETRQDRPEWAVRVVTVTGKTLVKLRDGRVFEPEG